MLPIFHHESAAKAERWRRNIHFSLQWTVPYIMGKKIFKKRQVTFHCIAKWISQCRLSILSADSWGNICSIYCAKISIKNRRNFAVVKIDFFPLCRPLTEVISTAPPLHYRLWRTVYHSLETSLPCLKASLKYYLSFSPCFVNFSFKDHNAI